MCVTNLSGRRAIFVFNLVASGYFIRNSKMNSATQMADASVLEQVDQLKAQGNECMQKRQFTKAAELYTKCIRVVPLHLPKKAAVCYANRALARLQTNDKQLLPAALLDARVSIELDPTYNKAYYRLSQVIDTFFFKFHICTKLRLNRQEPCYTRGCIALDIH